MVVKIHDIDIRVKYIVQLLHQVLVLVLKFLIANHKQNSSYKNELGKGLSEVLQKNFEAFKGTPLFKDQNYKRHFCLVDPHTTTLTNKLKITIDIESLDISILTLLILTKNFIFEKSNLSKCCSNCKHNKCSCGLIPKDCPMKANCGLICSCKDLSCGVVNILNFCSVARSLRNCFAHAADDVYQKLENKQGDLEGFPGTKTWTELWTLINDKTRSCLEVILKNDPNLLSKETYKDFKMELWFAFRKQINCLIPLVENNFAHYYKTILGEADWQEKVAQICKEMQHTRKDFINWNGNTIGFGDESLIRESFNVVMHADEGCILQYNSKYKKISIQCRQTHGEWNHLSEASTKTTTVGDITDFEVNRLNIGNKYDFRGLFENENGEILLLTSKESIEIKKVKAKDAIMIDGKRVSVEDFQISRLHVKSVCSDRIELIYDSHSIHEIKRIEIWDQSQSETWKNSDWEHIETEDDNILQGLNVVHLKSLEEGHMYDVRLISLGKDGEIKVLTRDGVKALDTAHNVFFHNNILMSHPFGLQTDASQHLEDLFEDGSSKHSTFTFSYKSGCGLEKSHITDNDCIRYVEENFWLGESGKKNIVVPHLEQLDQKSLNFQIAMKLKNLLPHHNNFLLTSVNFNQYLGKIGYSKQKLEDQFECHLKDLSNALVLYPAEYPAVILITLPESKQDTIHNLISSADANVKAYQILHRHRLIGKEGFMIINAICDVFHKESKLLLRSYCDSCDSRLLISAEDFKNDLQQWWSELKGMMATLAKNRRIKNDTNFLHETASRLVLFTALTDDRFPTLFADHDERISKMVLNEIQRNILFNPSPRKIIIGGYGCGKSIIVHQQIQRYQEKEKSILCYLCFDEYSLHQVLVGDHCEKISERLKQKIVCKSVVDVSLEAGSSGRLLSLTECLNEIQKCHPCKQIDIVVDELDGEDLKEEEVVKLKQILELPAFKSSMFYIALQSCQKKRQIEHNGRVEKETKTHYEDLGIEIFQLQKAMRFTSNIWNAVTSSQEKVEEEPNIYSCNLPKQAEIKVRPHYESCPVARTPKVKADIGVDEVRQRSGSTGRMEQNSAPKLSSMDVPTMKIDSSFRYSEVGESSTKIISRFEYFKSNGSCVNIKGKTPRLLRLNDEKSVQPLAYFLEEYCQCEDKMMLICNTKDLIDLSKAALQTVGLSYVEYTDSIRGLPAKATFEKKSILKEWRGEKQVLLVDCRGCRGMECQEVVVLWDEADYHSKHMFGESIARARSFLQIVTLNSNSSTNEVVDIFKKSSVKDVTQDCYAHAHTISNVVPVNHFRDSDAINSSLIRKLNDHLIAPLLSAVKDLNDPGTMLSSSQMVSTSKGLNDSGMTLSSSQMVSTSKRLNDSGTMPSSSQMVSTSKRNFLKWDGKIYLEVNVDGKTLRFDDVWKMLEDNKFDDASSIINKQPNIVNSMRGEKGQTFLMRAAYDKQKDIFGYLSNQQYDLSIVDVCGENVLHWIVVRNKDDVAFEMFKSLDISQLNDDVINKQDISERTPLHRAARKNKHKSIVWLMGQGADPSLKDKTGLRPCEHLNCSDETKRIIRSFRNW